MVTRKSLTDKRAGDVTVPSTVVAPAARRPAMVAVGGLFEAAFLTCLKTVIAHQPGDPVPSGDVIIFHEIGMHARAPTSLPRQEKTLANMGKKHHFFALAF